MISIISNCIYYQECNYRDVCSERGNTNDFWLTPLQAGVVEQGTVAILARGCCCSKWLSLPAGTYSWLWVSPPIVNCGILFTGFYLWTLTMTCLMICQLDIYTNLINGGLSRYKTSGSCTKGNLWHCLLFRLYPAICHEIIYWIHGRMCPAGRVGTLPVAQTTLLEYAGQNKRVWQLLSLIIALSAYHLIKLILIFRCAASCS